MDFPHTPMLTASSATAESLATSRIDQAAALLRSASSTVVRTAGATFAGGVIADGGESNSSLFWSLGGFVHVGLEGFRGGEMYPRGRGDLLGRAMNAAPGAGEVTILGSALGTLVLSGRTGRLLGPTARGGGGGIGFNPDPAPPRGWSPLFSIFQTR